MEDEYYEIPVDDVNHQTLTSGRWLKLSVAAIGGASFLILSVVATIHPISRLKSTEADIFSNFVALDTLRNRPAMAHVAQRTSLLRPAAMSNKFEVDQAAVDEGVHRPTMTRRVLCGAPMASAILPFCLENSPALAVTKAGYTSAEGVEKVLDVAKTKTDPYKVDILVKNLKDGSDGKFTIVVHPEWAPIGAARFKKLAFGSFYSQTRFFRVIDGFAAQFGISGDPELSAMYRDQKLKDDPVTQTNTKGKISFATSGKDARTTQIFINLGDNAYLDKQGFAPFAEVVDGLSVVEKLYGGYGEKDGPKQQLIQEKGNEYLEAQFPKLSFIDGLEFQ